MLWTGSTTRKKFLYYFDIIGLVVQLVRMPPCHPHNAVGTGSKKVLTLFDIIGLVVQLVRMPPVIPTMLWGRVRKKVLTLLISLVGSSVG